MPKPRDSYHHGDLKRALVEAAVAQIAEHGPAGVTLRGVSRLAGVSQTAPYRHFTDKEALLAAVAEQGFEKLAERMREAGERHPDDPLDRWRAMGVAYVQFAAAQPAHYRVMFGPRIVDKSRHPALEQAADAAFEFLRQAIDDCSAAGLLRPADPNELALVAWSTVHGLANLVVDGQLTNLGFADVPPEQLAERVTSHLMAGLALDGVRDDLAS